jgi:hypothetical protein
MVRLFACAILTPLVIAAAGCSSAGGDGTQSSTSSDTNAAVPAPAVGNGWTFNGQSNGSAPNVVTFGGVSYPQLVYGGSAFWPNPVDASSIAISFDVDFTDNSGGLALVFADATTTSPTTVGTGGSGLGVLGIGGVAVTFATAQSVVQMGDSWPQSGPAFVGITGGLLAGFPPYGGAQLQLDAAWGFYETASLPTLVYGTPPSGPLRTHFDVTTAQGALEVRANGTLVIADAPALPSQVLLGFTAGGWGSGQKYLTNVVIGPGPQPVTPVSGFNSRYECVPDPVSPFHPVQGFGAGPATWQSFELVVPPTSGDPMSFAGVPTQGAGSTSSSQRVVWQPAAVPQAFSPAQPSLGRTYELFNAPPYDGQEGWLDIANDIAYGAATVSRVAFYVSGVTYENSSLLLPEFYLCQNGPWSSPPPVPPAPAPSDFDCQHMVDGPHCGYMSDWPARQTLYTCLDGAVSSSVICPNYANCQFDTYAGRDWCPSQ